ncbi:uncharacterized protein LOC131288992 [Anopheles ziemanni]|uniref:uncharacterized protein LOC131259700 n=1 Tax=Anopheles coustani TaxID=139045 RepID=UPI00265863D9|nr:uncharacterized protein LOC131259700 [Anopheles coustani]XP_058174160.1 uncharacterized protein LOC131288992 [Anopheles ziemanni]
MQLAGSGKCFGTGAVFGVVLFGLVLAQVGSGDAFLSFRHVVTERIANQTDFVNSVLSDELPLKIVEFSQHVYDWDRDTLKITGKWVLSSPNDDYLYFVEYAQKIDKSTGFKEILEDLNSKQLITDIKRVERVKPQSFTFEKTFVFGKK